MDRIDTPQGPVEYLDEGDGPCVLFVHGSPGGADQGSLMTRFLRDRGHRTVTFSRPGYLGTPLTDANGSPDAQAAMALSLLDARGVDRFGLLCWSGGGPSAYRLAATAPDRVTALVGIAALSDSFAFEGTGEEKMLMGRFGAWLMKEMVRHSPKSTVSSLVKEEGDLDKDTRRALVESIWSDEERRAFALDLMGTIVGDRKAGFENDVDQYAHLDLDLGAVTAPALLIHARTDADVPYAQSEHARDRLPDARLVTIEGGTHVSVWTDPDAAGHQETVAAFLAR